MSTVSENFIKVLIEPINPAAAAAYILVGFFIVKPYLIVS